MTKKVLFFPVLFFMLFFIFGIAPKKAEAVKFELIAPSGRLKRGQDVQFTINIDTEGATVTSQQIGLTYDTSLLQYVNTTPGAAMNSVEAADQGGGKLLMTGTNTAGFVGKGAFAVVTLKIIAESAGSTQLCTLWAPAPTATPIPTGSPQPTSPPAPTSLPKTGGANKTITVSILGAIIFIVAAAIYFLNTNTKYEKPLTKKNK